LAAALVRTQTEVQKMATTVRARVHDGRLELLDKVDLPEGAEVAVTITEASRTREFGAFRRSAGSWRGLVDADKLIRNIYRDRLISTRKRPRL
jgi:predicted DNA-binding antitoxin AbrB/MazE fold protein